MKLVNMGCTDTGMVGVQVLKVEQRNPFLQLLRQVAVAVQVESLVLAVIVVVSLMLAVVILMLTLVSLMLVVVRVEVDWLVVGMASKPLQRQMWWLLFDLKCLSGCVKVHRRQLEARLRCWMN